MALYSMTGFATVSGVGHGARWSLEARSVNHKHLDVRVRFPSGFEELEEAVKREAGQTFSRGSLQLSLAFERQEDVARPAINRELLTTLVRETTEVANSLGLEPPQLDAYLVMRGVVDWQEKSADTAADKALVGEIFSDFKKLFASLKAARSSEGERLSQLMADQLSEIESLTNAASELGATQPEAIFERLRLNVSALLDGSGKLDEARLHQEAALMAAKADVREELDRLHSHVAEGRAIMKAGSPAGRKLDFLAQEFNREANTLCSKSSDAELTRIGLALKLIIDQMREQVQNIE